MFSSPSSFSELLLDWYEQNHRALPWRPERGSRVYDAYKVLVSEFMLQQTQVAAVVPYFERFMERFPSVRELAEADEQAVLRLWQGLGYYGRARNLHAAAKRLMEEFGSVIPGDAEELLSLPGVGRYTAGAIGSIAFGKRVPILDANVARVLCRLDKISDDPRSPEVLRGLWHRAEEILPEKKVGEFNSALMELGAAICRPVAPSCLICPVREFCEARAAGLQDAIPLRKKRKATPLHHRWTICIRSGDQWLIEQRPPKGRWANLWQFITIPAEDSPPTTQRISKLLGLPLIHFRSLLQLKHALTHRRYVFDVFAAHLKGKSASFEDGRVWATLAGLGRYPLSRPQIHIVEALKRISD